MCGRGVQSSRLSIWRGASPSATSCRARSRIGVSHPRKACSRFGSIPEIRERTLDALRWGLVPIWAKDVSIGCKQFNALSETVASKRRSAKPSRNAAAWSRSNSFTSGRKGLLGKRPLRSG